MSEKLTHINEEGMPSMVDISDKKTTIRTAKARSVVEIDDAIRARLSAGDIHTAKGPVFQTAIIAGIMAAKKTSELIPMCHPLSLDKCNVDIRLNNDQHIQIECMVRITGKTGVEMEALTGATVAALTVYDMCKGISQNMSITQTRLIEKTGGKSDIQRT